MPDPIDDLIANLRFCRAWADICEHYLSPAPTPEAGRFLRHMLATERQIVEELAHELRQKGVAAGQIEGNDDLIADADKRRTQSTRLQFIQIGLERMLAWHQSRLADPASPYHDLWQNLHDRQALLLIEVKRLLGQPATNN